jgi:hypothetical protein
MRKILIIFAKTANLGDFCENQKNIFVSTLFKNATV